ncbi:hypothetical protein A6X21_05395 [Planctopirus hydrillae]|uniref:Uncharacterized protein n=1 Tax=Planctopirus hydrillae TaxID=1841610 RepID=A0A1C3EBZ6_9PLAN|nr:hypothetical protein A6X21_05395 [Planctopirus hydrillae]
MLSINPRVAASMALNMTEFEIESCAKKTLILSSTERTSREPGEGGGGYNMVRIADPTVEAIFGDFGV